MRRMIKSAAAVILAVCVCCSFSVMMPDGAQAKTKKLSQSYVTLVQGGSKTIKLSSGSGKWSVKNGKIVRLKNKKKNRVTVYPKKPGTTVVYCKSGSKKLKCKVRVLNKKAGKLMDDRLPAVIKGKTCSLEAQLDSGMRISKTKYDKTRAKITVKHKDGDIVTLKIYGKKTGKLKVQIFYNTGDTETVVLHVVPGFRGSKSVKNTKTNYRKWRRAWIKNAVSQDMTSWEVIDAVGYLISTGKYANVGNNNGQTLWYTGKGTCVSGAKMMNDFLKDIGVASKVRFAGGDGTTNDVFGYTISFGSGHKNVRVWFKGHTYHFNPQPGFPWPYGIIRIK